ncbi:SDR family NAD(P)-dependent oxidoreductase [Rhodopirellula europaea]|uniref:Short-chain dehydrogenase/reductase SDR n=1 Tax=Rhodopirellula europaea SH398 TaxID=1263868 RepID=M5RV00_9BACT|nr:SDR family NAD(P)-dependent oxidoreductase [Rhodopirellula europaea]EMI23168.1 short-chain dehydrogenase/reductase SDR [Rhodopirellula europaea SH398]
MKRILITGATDGIGFETAKILVSRGHHVLIHGRSEAKLQRVAQSLKSLSSDASIESYLADLSNITEVESLANAVAAKGNQLDALINNAGVLSTSDPMTSDGLDVRFAVNTIAPYLLTKRLLSRMDSSGRVINVSSAAQKPVDMAAFRGERQLDDLEAYSQSKLALTMWSRGLADKLGADGPAIIAVNPGSLLSSKMVHQAFGVPGKDITIGANILVHAALDDEFADASGQYFNNDAGEFGPPHADALDAEKNAAIIDHLESILATA